MNAYEIPGLRYTVIADTDCKKHRFIKLNASGKAVYATAATDPIIGVSYTDAKSGAPMSVAGNGVLMVEAGGSIAPGKFVTASAEGKAIEGDKGFIALTSAEAGQLVSVKF